MSDDRLATWVEMQQRLWHGDSQSKACKIVVRKKGEEAITFQVPVGDKGEDIAGILRTALQMQAQELPGGAHTFILSAIDEHGNQLMELPQTIRGNNRDATSAAAEAIGMANAHAKAISNLDTVIRRQDELNAKLNELNLSLIEDRQRLADAYTEERGVNHQQLLEFKRFERACDRMDKLVESVAPLVTLIGEKLITKHFGSAEQLAALLSGETPAKDDAANATQTTTEPFDPARPIVPQSGSGGVPPNGAGRGKANSRSLSAGSSK